MIRLNLELINPYCHRRETVFYRGKLISANKSAELQVVKDSTIVSLGLHFTPRQDHAGITLTIGLFGYSVMLSCHGTRHWNDEHGRWSIYDQAGNAP